LAAGVGNSVDKDFVLEGLKDNQIWKTFNHQSSTGGRVSNFGAAAHRVSILSSASQTAARKRR